MYHVFNRARPFDERPLAPGLVLERKADGKTVGVQAYRDTNDRIAYQYVSRRGERKGDRCHHPGTANGPGAPIGTL